MSSKTKSVARPAVTGEVRNLPPALLMACPACWKQGSEIILSSHDALNCITLPNGRLKWTGVVCPQCKHNWAMEANVNEFHEAHKAAAHAPKAAE